MIFGITLFYLAPAGQAASVANDIKKGNRLYKDEKFDEALEAYNKAQDESPDSDIVNFDVGTVLYKKEDYQKAVQSLTKSLTTENLQLESKANYNIGNARVRQGQSQENTDLSRAINLYKEALNYYKRAIELDEKDEDAKFNYEFVEKKIKELMEQQQPQQQQQEQEEKDKEQQQQEQEQEEKKQKREQEEQDKEQKEKEEEQEQKEQEQKQKEQQEQEQKQEEQQEQEEKEQQKQKEQEEQERKEQEQKEKEQKEQEEKQEKEKQEPEQPQPQPQPSSGQTPQSKEEEPAGGAETEGMPEEWDQMSEEEARMLIEGYQQEEEAKDIEAQKKKAVYPRVLKDW